MGWTTGGRVTNRGTNSVSIMTTFGGTPGYRLTGVRITSKVKLNTGASTSVVGRVTFGAGGSADVGSVSFSNLSPGTYYTASISSSGSYQNVSDNYKWYTCSASGSVGFWTLAQYTVSYNANGGNSTPGTQYVAEGSSINLAGAISRNNSTASGQLSVSYNANGGSGAPTTVHKGEYVNTTTYTFNGWHEGSASGTNHSAGSSFKPTGSVTLYAGWNTNTSRTTNPSIKLSSTIPTRTNYTFLGWSTNSGATSATYSAGGTYTFSENTTLYAVWKPNPPHNVKVNFVSNTTTSINVSVAASGLTITKYVLYYRAGTSGDYTSKDLGTGTTANITSLAVDTNYQFYVAATNIGGTTNSSVTTLSTKLNNPTITTPVVSNLLPFTCTITATGSVTPNRTLSYRFSKDGGSTWTAYQLSNVYNWTGLNEETTYNMTVQVKATHVGNNATDTTASKSITITTPADQAKIRRMIDGQWKKGKTYLMVDGKWVKAKKLYIMIDGQWKLNDNE